jgi:hypothetical protein
LAAPGRRASLRRQQRRAKEEAVTADLEIELVCRADSAPEFARVVGTWFTDALQEAFPWYAEQLAADPELGDLRDPKVRYGAWGPPGGVYASWSVNYGPSPRKNRRSGTYSAKSWRSVLEQLASRYPYQVVLLLYALDEAGRPAGGETAVVFTAGRVPDAPEWVQLSIDVPQDRQPWQGSAEIQGGWVDFLRRWAERLDADYGHITDDADRWFGTALERAVSLPVHHSIPHCREVLRGYSWVTICDSVIAQRLGGVAALSESGAFHQVVQLPTGQLLLRATPLLEQYEGITVTRVFEATAPVLLPGRADPDTALPWSRLVLDVDAADYRER